MQLDTGSPKLLAVHQTCHSPRADPTSHFEVETLAIASWCSLWMVKTQPYCQGQTTTRPRVVSRSIRLLNSSLSSPVARLRLASLGFALTFSVGSRLESKLLCECSSQEECLARIMRTASEHLVPSNICAIQRKMCGETVDFHPEFSQTFSPARFAISPFLNSPGKQEVQAMCFLHRACSLEFLKVHRFHVVSEL